MVTVAQNRATTNHRPPAGTAVSNAPHSTPSSTASNTRMAKPDSKSDKTPKKPARSAGTKPTSVLESSAELRNTVAAIEKQFGEGSIMPLGGDRTLPIEGIPTGSLSLDIALGGQGIPRGRIIEIFGPESSGKTTLALHVVAQAQKAGGIAAFIDAEHALDPSWAKKLGVELETLLVSQPSSGEEAMQITEMLIKINAVDVIVIDSVAALVPQKELEGEIGDSHVGLQARLMSQSMRKLTGAIAKSKTAVIFINQIREKIGVMFGSPETTPGGRALKFYSLLPHRRPPHRPAQGRRGGRRPAGAGQGRQEQGRPAVPRRRVRHDAHQRHQLRRRHPRPGHGAEDRRPHRRLVPLRRHAARPGQGKGPRCTSRRIPKLTEEIKDKIMAAGGGKVAKLAGSTTSGDDEDATIED